METVRRVLGVDYGERRIGLAISDPLGLTAQPLAVLTNRPEKVVAEILAIIAEKQVLEVVIGEPRHMNGQAGVGAEVVKAFGELLAGQAGVKVHYIDERLTTVAAQRVLTESGMSGGKKRQAVDKIAAAIILQTWLERRRNQTTPGPG